MALVISSPHGAAALADEVGEEHALHAPVDVVGEAADIESLDEARGLHEQCDGDVSKHEHGHRAESFAPAENVGKALGKLALEPRPREKTEVIDKPRDRDEGERQPLHAEIGADAVGTKGAVILHGGY